MSKKVKVQTGERTEGCVDSLPEAPVLVNTQNQAFQVLLSLNVVGSHRIYFCNHL